MRDDLKRGFESAMAKLQQREKENQQTLARLKTEAETFSQNWADLIASTVDPALQEVVEQVLVPNGWHASVSKGATNDSIRLQAAKGKMTAVAGGGQPNIRFSPDVRSRKIDVYSATMNEGIPLPSLTLSQITKDKIQELALDFFKRLIGP